LILLSFSAGGGNNGQSVAAATYLKNFTRRNINSENPNSKSNVSKEFKDKLMRSLLQVEPPVLKVLVETVHTHITQFIFHFNTCLSPLHTLIMDFFYKKNCWQFRIIIAAEFVKQNNWPELVPELWSAIQNSNLISTGANCEWKTINALTVLQALVRPFQVLIY
jgi:hypothetical protein